jgi:hypothetical protein
VLLLLFALVVGLWIADWLVAACCEVGVVCVLAVFLK